MFANVNYRTLDTFAEIMTARFTKTLSSIEVVGRKAKTRRATETVHGQHQAVDSNDSITVRTCYRRPQSLEGKSSVN